VNTQRQQQQQHIVQISTKSLLTYLQAEQKAILHQTTNVHIRRNDIIANKEHLFEQQRVEHRNRQRNVSHVTGTQVAM